MRRMGIVLVVAAVALAGGCASGRGAVRGDQSGAGDNDALAAPEANTWVHASNQNWQDIDLFLVRPGLKVRLGMVTSMGSMSFRIPKSVMDGSAGVRLLVSPIGGGNEYMTPEIALNPGEVVQLEVENELRLSSYSVR